MARDVADRMERPFEYAALLPRHIRLLKVTQDPKLGRLQFEFLPVSLDDLPCTYTAVSYLWGSAVKSERVWRGNEYVEVTTSAMSILKEVAAPGASYIYMNELHADQDIEADQDLFTGPSWIWIDALCIDQHNKAERAAQVRLMRDVFASARKVLAWVDHIPEYDGVLDFVAELHGVLYDLRERGRPVTLKSLDTYPVCQDISSWNRLADFLRNPWFSRVWVIQEVVVPKHVELKCGPVAMSWAYLAELLLLLREHNVLERITTFEEGQVMTSPHGFQSVLRAWSIRVLFHHDIPRTLSSLLNDFWRYGASDGRDKLFAVIGMATDAEDSDFEPDYTVPQNVIFERLAARLLTRDACSTLMLHAAGIGLSGRDDNLPSWVADWTAPFLNTMFGDSSSAGYNAGGNAASPWDAVYDSATHTLELSGHIIDSITWLAEATPPAIWHSTGVGMKELMATELARIEHIRAQYPENKYPGSASDFYPEVLSRLLVANMFLSGQKAPTECVDDFSAFMNFATWICQATPQDLDAPDQLYAPEQESFLDDIEYVDATRRYKSGMNVAISRRFFGTGTRYSGIGFPGIGIGDQVCLFRGFNTPFILRRGDSGAYKLVGECYIYGLMNKEGLALGPEERITLV